MKHFLSIRELSADKIQDLLDKSEHLKQQAKNGDRSFRPLAHQNWGLIFSKSSTRTRVSFEVGVRQLGGSALFFSGRDLQLGRGEPIEDMARVLGRMIDGAIIRTFDQQDVVTFAERSGIPTINALTDEEHPCQIIADLLTIHETRGSWKDIKIAFLGDPGCNMGRSWAWAAEHLGFQLALAGPEGYHLADDEIRGFSSNVIATTDPVEAARDADVLYTDVWISMGKEDEGAERIAAMAPFQINDPLVAHAKPDASVMHCLPAYRGKEITAEILEAHAETIFQQAENRVHAQKAVLAEINNG